LAERQRGDKGSEFTLSLEGRSDLPGYDVESYPPDSTLAARVSACAAES